MFAALGLSCGAVQGGMTPEEYKAAYACDITYVTGQELGFSYLRDNSAASETDVVGWGGVEGRPDGCVCGGGGEGSRMDVVCICWVRRGGGECMLGEGWVGHPDGWMHVGGRGGGGRQPDGCGRAGGEWGVGIWVVCVFVCSQMDVMGRGGAAGLLGVV